MYMLHSPVFSSVWPPHMLAGVMQSFNPWPCLCGNVWWVSGDTLFLVKHNTEVLVRWDIYIIYIILFFICIPVMMQCLISKGHSSWRGERDSVSNHVGIEQPVYMWQYTANAWSKFLNVLLSYSMLLFSGNEFTYNVFVWQNMLKLM